MERNNYIQDLMNARWANEDFGRNQFHENFHENDFTKNDHRGGNSRQTSDSTPKNKHTYFHPKEGKLTADEAPKSKQTAATGSPKSKQTDFKDTEYQAHRHDQYPTRSACNSSNFRPAYNPRNVAMRSFYDHGQRSFQSK